MDEIRLFPPLMAHHRSDHKSATDVQSKNRQALWCFRVVFPFTSNPSGRITNKLGLILRDVVYDTYYDRVILSITTVYETNMLLGYARKRCRKGVGNFSITRARVRLAQAAISERETSVADLCNELRITHTILYPNGELREYGHQVLDMTP